ncbi:MAG: hypothetical protein R2848_01490 [Thermomicrobiales bacterium]
MSCAQTSAAAPVTIDIPAVQHIDVATPEPPLEHIGATLAQHLSETLPLDCGDGATPSASEHPATFDTQPFVPGYLVSTIQLDEEATDFFARHRRSSRSTAAPVRPTLHRPNPSTDRAVPARSRRPTAPPGVAS